MNENKTAGEDMFKFTYHECFTTGVRTEIVVLARTRKEADKKVSDLCLGLNGTPPVKIEQVSQKVEVTL